MDGLGELGALVRRHRSDAGLSGAELARRAGVSQPSVWFPRVPLHGFTIADDEAVHVETFTAELTPTNPDDVAAYSGSFAAFEEAAVFGDAAVDGITRAVEDFVRLTGV